MSKDKKGQRFPRFETNEAAEKFVDQADLSQFDFSAFKPVSFEMKRKDKRVNLRLSENLLTLIKQKAESHGIPYQRYIRHLIEQDVRS